MSSPPSSFGFAEQNVTFDAVGRDLAANLSHRFRPIMQIASGGMGRIYLVQETLSGRYVALKVMAEAALPHTELVHQFIREAVITARLEHPHIIPVHELGFLSAKQLFYTMTYVDGITFDEMHTSTTLFEALRILRAAALAASHAHSQGLWHRDIKPQNIMVGKRGEVYLIDWGLVSIQPDRTYSLNLPKVMIANQRSPFIVPDQLLERTRGAVTETASFMGTPRYMSPEQIRNGRSGAPSDVWAFGVILFEVLTGAHPAGDIDGLNGVQIAQHLACLVDTPHPRDVRPGVPPPLDKLCKQMLAMDPAQRPQSLDLFIESLSTFLKRSGETVIRMDHGGVSDTAVTVVRPNSIPYPSVDTQQFPGSPPGFESEEATRLRQKNEILLEIASSSVFAWARRRRLWAQLARL